MLSRIFFITAFTCFTFMASAQEQCARTMIYFDFGKSDLRKDARQRLDSLAKAIGKDTFIIELSGHCDSVNTEEFNQKLSQARIKSVETYLKQKTKAKHIFKQFARGELKPMVPNSSDDNMAKNRRVDVYLLAAEDDKFVFRGGQNQSLEIPADFPGNDCSICEALKLTFVKNDDEARAANVPLKSSAGRELTTGGMVQFSFDCPEKAAACLPVKFITPSHSALRFECLNAGILARGGSWESGKAELKMDRSANTYVTTDGCYKMGSWAGINKPMVDLCKHQVNFPAELTIMKTKVYSNDSVFFTEPSRFPHLSPCGHDSRMFSWAKAEGGYHIYQDGWRKNVSSSENTGNCDTLFTYNLTKDHFKAIPASDSTVYLKIKGFTSVKAPGYYIEELDLFLPFDNVKKTTYSANYLNYDHRLIIEGDDATYNLNMTDDLKTKYKKGKKRLKVGAKKKKMPVK